MPAEDVTVSEMLQGPPGPSLAENLREGQYLDAGLQALGAIPFVGAAAKGPVRAVQRKVFALITALPTILSDSTRARSDQVKGLKPMVTGCTLPKGKGLLRNTVETLLAAKCLGALIARSTPILTLKP